MKIISFLCLLVCSLTISAAEISEELRTKIANEKKVQQELISKFNELFSIKLNQGDKTAKAIAKKAQLNAGSLKIDFEEMKAALLKWDKGISKDIAKLPTEKEKIMVVKSEFERLLKEKVDAKDEEALKLANHGHRNGKIDLSVSAMREYIAKWKK